MIFGITLLFLPALFNNEANSYIFKSLAIPYSTWTIYRSQSINHYSSSAFPSSI
jgi:hypothetical protein